VTGELKALPQPTPISAPFWQAAREGRLVVQRCEDCGHRQLYPRSLCTACGEQRLGWHECSGRGRVKTFTVIRRAVSAAYEPDVPYVVALIELEEGPTLMSNVVGCVPEAVGIGAPVRVRFDAWTPEATVPVFVLAVEEP
jgi:uncharacterized OB-fold protein